MVIFSLPFWIYFINYNFISIKLLILVIGNEINDCWKKRIEREKIKLLLFYLDLNYIFIETH